MSTCRVAVWGVGPHAVKNILPAIAAARDIELAGMYSRNQQKVAEARTAFGGRSWTSPEAMLADRDVDAVYISTPTGLHAAQGEQALRAGKHLWCEKPIVEELHQAQRLVDAARERDLVVAEAFMYVHHPQFKQLLDIVARRIGTPVSVTCRFGIPPLERASFRSVRALGGGALLDVGSYTASAVLALLPDAEPDVLFAEMTTAPGSEVDTAGRAVLRCGAIGAFLEWRTESAYRAEIDVWGTEGSVRTDRIFSKPVDYVPQLHLLDRGGHATIEAGQAENHFVTMLEAFRRLGLDAAAAERERLTIIARARLMDRIRARSHSSGTM